MLSSTKSADHSETPTASAPKVLVILVTKITAPGLTANTVRPSAIAANRGYTFFSEAWSACGFYGDCSYILKYSGGYYLRRGSDPDGGDELANTAMPYNCPQAGFEWRHLRAY